jgi:hypothetical protein
VPEHRADGTLGVLDRQLDLDRAAVVEHDALPTDELVVEVLVELVVLLAEVAPRLGLREVGTEEHGREVESRRLPVRRRAVDVEQLAAADDLVERAVAELARYSRTPCAMNSKKFTTNSGLPENRLRSSGFCVATPTGQVSRWQTRIMTQPCTTSGRGGEAELLAPSSAPMITTSRPVFS